MSKENTSIPVVLLCHAFNLARSSYYAALKAKIKNDELDQHIWKRILKVWESLPGLGYRKLADRLKKNGKKIRSILKTYRRDWKPKQVRAKKQEIRRIQNVVKLITQALINNPEKQKRNNWILRHGKNKYRHVIDPTRPYQLWAADWKELKIPLIGITMYIFVIIDCYTRQLMGWELSIVKDSRAAIRAGEMAIKKAKLDPLFHPRKLIMHSDQGSAYTSDETMAFWRQQGIILSTADRGKPTQNPYIEAFFSILVRFWLKYNELNTVLDARKSLNAFFNTYNSEWPHGSLNNMAPDEKLSAFQAVKKRKEG